VSDDDPDGGRARWDARWAGADPNEGDASPVVIGLLRDLELPAGGVLDLAGGPGRNAVWLAAAGHDVTVLDVSPTALRLADARAQAAGVSLRTVEADLTRAPIPAGPWALALVSHYLQRDLFADIATRLVPGGALVIVHPTQDNLQRHARPSVRFLLARGEAEALARGAGLTVERSVEDWVGDGDAARHLARVVARRPGGD
jgi:SAM-dependent methyltransferase